MGRAGDTAERLGWAVLVIIAVSVGVPLQFAHAQSKTESGGSSGTSSGSESSENGGAAAPADEDATRGRVVESSDERLRATVRRPEGWIHSDSNSEAMATFQAASDKRAKIEVRYSSPVRAPKREAYFNSFHSQLKSAGFVQKGETEVREFGSKTGRETEYEGDTGETTYRLVIWEYYRNRTAWIIAGFFAAERRDRHYDALGETAESLSFERTDEK
jgi:hypothetical protein